MRLILCLIMVLIPAAAHAAVLADVEAAVMDKDYAAGRDLASKLSKTTTDHKVRLEASYYLGLCYLRLGQFPRARSILKEVMNGAPSQDLYEKAALGVAEGLYMQGFYSDALKASHKLLFKYPNSPSKSLIYLKIARANLKLMRWEEAKAFLNKLIKEFPQSFEAPIAKGLLEEKEFFAVQVGAFLDQEKAMHLVEELKSKAQYAYIVETVSPEGRKFYRVRVGQIASLDSAQSVQTQLSRQGYPSLIYP